MTNLNSRTIITLILIIFYTWQICLTIKQNYTNTDNIIFYSDLLENHDSSLLFKNDNLHRNTLKSRNDVRVSEIQNTIYKFSSFYTIPDIVFSHLVLNDHLNSYSLVLNYNNTKSDYDFYSMVNSLLNLENLKVNKSYIKTIYLPLYIKKNTLALDYLSYILKQLNIHDYQIHYFDSSNEIQQQLASLYSLNIIIMPSSENKLDLITPQNVNTLHNLDSDLNEYKRYQYEDKTLFFISLMKRNNDPIISNEDLIYHHNKYILRLATHVNMTTLNMSEMSIQDTIKTMISTDVAITFMNDNLYFAVFLLPHSSLIVMNPINYEDSNIVKQLSIVGSKVFELPCRKDEHDLFMNRSSLDYHSLYDHMQKSIEISERFFTLTLILSITEPKANKYNWPVLSEIIPYTKPIY